MITHRFPAVVFFLLGFHALAATVVAQTAPAAPVPQAKIDFSGQVQPLLSKYCYACHGPDQQKSGLRLDRRDEALAPADSDERAIVPGDPQASRLMKVIDGRDGEFSMPPKGAKPTADQIKLIRDWIAQGAEYNAHWSFVAPKRPELPPVINKTWPRNEIDHFILARLEAQGLTPSPEADAYTLVRRVYLDLIGIPPTPEEADAFVKEYVGEVGSRESGVRGQDAYERLVDRLLASPHYGERWARRWLDLARYSDTNGYEKDRIRSIWPYRDWVIRAINEDMPFDQFTIQQIAGDLLYEQRRGGNSELETRNALLTATGFHRNTMINEEGGIDVEEFRYHAVADRVGTTGAVWLGLTLACAQCHTHKYDPITHQEYFQLFAFLNNADEPDIELVTADIQSKRDEIAARILQMEAALADQFTTVEPGELTWTTLKPTVATATSGTKLAIAGDHSILAKPANDVAAKDTYTIEAFHLGKDDIVAIRLEALTDPALPGTGPGLTPHGNFVLSEFKLAATTGPPAGNPPRPVPIAFSRATADVSQNKFDIANTIDGNPATGWAIDDGSGKINQSRTATFHLAKPLAVKGGAKLTFTLVHDYGSRHVIGRLRLSVARRSTPATDIAQTPAKRQEYLQSEMQKWIDAQKPAARLWTTLTPTTITGSKGGTFITQPDGAVLVTGDNPNQNVYTFETDVPLKAITALRLEVLPDESLPNGGPGRAPLFSDGDFHLGEFRAAAIAKGGHGEPVNIIFGEAFHSFAQSGRSAQLAIDGDPDTAWSIKGGTGRAHQAVFVLKNALRNDQGSKLTITLDQRYIHQMTIGKFRLSATGAAPPVKASELPAQVEAIIAKPQTTWSAAERAAIERHFLLTTPVLAAQQKAIEQVRNSMPRGHKTMVMQERDPQHARTTHIHNRGEFLQPTKAVTVGVLEILHPLKIEKGTGDDGAKPQVATRLDFARWLVDQDNPLVGRVVMNRQWEAFFGRGIVRTSEDFGLQGEKPTHPALLDWLAMEFMGKGAGDGGQGKGDRAQGAADDQSPRTPVRGSPSARAFSMKQMHKLIVMSATYRQSSHVSPLLLERDPQNVLLSRGPRFRVEAEMIRDSALTASGLLSRRIGGPSVFPPQPAGVTSLGYGGFNWATATGENRYRRGLYTFAKRTTPFAAFVTFDGPTGDTCLVRRDRSNTPLQALTMMNDPVFVEAAQALAGRLLKEEHADDDARLTRLFRLVLTRPPAAMERDVMKDFLVKQRQRINDGALDAGKIAPAAGKDVNVKELAAWTTLARSVMNLDETVTKE